MVDLFVSLEQALQDTHRRGELAQQVGVSTIGRDIFLDPVVGDASVEQQLQKALSIATQRGQVVVIGHPFKETLEVLEKQLPLLTDSYSFITISSYFNSL